MKKLAIISLCMLLALSVKAGKVDTVLVHSTVMNKDVKTVVITPTETKKNRDQRYPVLYLLHGATGNCKYYLEKVKATLPEIADEKGMIFVTPDALNSWYIDSPINKNLQYETFTSKELVEYIDSHYRTIADRKGRAVTEHGWSWRALSGVPPQGCLWRLWQHEWWCRLPWLPAELGNQAVARRDG